MTTAKQYQRRAWRVTVALIVLTFLIVVWQ
jgi:hypothetical protein